MHELGIADAVVEIAVRHAGGRRVRRIELTIGHLRQVVPSALSFAIELVSQGTAAQDAVLAITHVPAAGRCRACGADGALTAFPLACARCGSLAVDLTAGEELCVETIEVDGDEPSPREGTHG